MVADATGHGVSSALITASARGAFSVIQKMAETDPTFPFSPGLMMDMANRVVFDSAKTKVMMTAFIGVIDLDEKKLIYANASHNPPWLFRGPSNKGHTESLVPEGLRLGEEESPPQYTEFEVSLSPGDTIVLYSDGYLENQNSKGEIYGKKRARKKIEENLAAHPQALIDSLIVDFKAFNGEKPLDDDATLAAIRILNPSTEAST
jgi:sigma-B regulation protein RsbU (phosphoserine phosphatase)